MPNKDEKDKDILPLAMPRSSDYKIEQELYTKNAELDAINELLSLTQELYEISLLSIDPAALAERIATTMRDRLHLEMAGVFLFNREQDVLTPLAFAKSERLLATLRQFGFLLRDISITEITKRPAFKNIFNGKPFVTANASDVWGGLIQSKDIEKFSLSANLKTIIIYPLLTEERVIGTVLLGYTSPYEQFSQIEKESIKSFANVIAGALDKSYTYKELVTTNKNLTAVNKKMELANEKLKTIDKTKSSILSFAQHYLQNPIENIVMASAMLADGSFGDKIEDTKKASARMLESARHLSLTVKMWLRALDFEENRVKYGIENFDLADMMKNITKDWVLIATNRGIVFSLETDHHSPYMVTADKTWIYEVIINLVDNAFKMTEKGFIKMRIEKIGIEKVRFCVSDSGIGIDGQTLPMLFQKFERGQTGWKKNVEGTGLGLYISKKIIEEGHHGRIWAESEGIGKGATFCVELPV